RGAAQRGGGIATSEAAGGYPAGGGRRLWNSLASVLSFEARRAGTSAPARAAPSRSMISWILSSGTPAARACAIALSIMACWAGPIILIARSLLSGPARRRGRSAPRDVSRRAPPAPAGCHRSPSSQAAGGDRRRLSRACRFTTFRSLDAAFGRAIFRRRPPTVPER